VLAVVLAAAINVLTPRDPFAGTIVHRETSADSRTASVRPLQAVDVSGAQRRRAPARRCRIVRYAFSDIGTYAKRAARAIIKSSSEQVR
jgi:hypothetical protein